MCIYIKIPQNLFDLRYLIHEVKFYCYEITEKIESNFFKKIVFFLVNILSFYIHYFKIYEEIKMRLRLYVTFR